MSATENDRIMSEVFKLGESMDAAALTAYFAPDATYHNIPMPALRGIAEIRTGFEGLRTRFRSLRIQTLRQIAVGDLVMNERLDTFTFHDGSWVQLPIAGVFELRGGKIQSWRDYFDLATFRRHGADGTGPVPPAQWIRAPG